MFIRAHDAEDVIHREPQGFHHNRYHRQSLYALMNQCGFDEPAIVYDSPLVRNNMFQDEVLAFRRRSWMPPPNGTKKGGTIVPPSKILP